MKNNNEKPNVAIIGSGIIGLSSALMLSQHGVKVTLFDQDSPGMGSSFGNAGLFADYARLPFSTFTMMRNMPKLLLDRESPLSIKPAYMPNLVSYGWHFSKACFPANYKKGKAALLSLHNQCAQADQFLQEISNTGHLIQKKGVLALFATDEGIKNAQNGDWKERAEQGVEIDYLSKQEVADLEPGLSSFHSGGALYRNASHTISPYDLCREYFKYFQQNNGNFIQERVTYLEPNEQGVLLHTALQSRQFDQLVLTAGIATKELLSQFDISLPMVSERGYHVMLDGSDITLNRPVGWMDKGIFLTPMEKGIRVAGTAEFADLMAPPDRTRTDVMTKHANAMLDHIPSTLSHWVGSRPSTPDSLPFIGKLKELPQVNVATGHGHLGLTFASITGQLVKELVLNQTPSVELAPFSPERFCA